MGAKNGFVLGAWVVLLACVGCAQGDGDGAAASQQDAHRQAIIDGPVEEGYPAIGGLVNVNNQQNHDRSFCSGTLIDPGWVLTAAHCINNARNREGDNLRLHFFIGTDTGDQESGRVHKVERIHVHPQYNQLGGERHYDIALLELREPIDDIVPIPIHRERLDERVGVELFYVGFGTTAAQGGESGVKRSATLTLHEVLPVSYLTAQDGGGVCFGDSGGPGLLDVGEGELEVIGVNSTVVGEPVCQRFSNQIRVDVYQTWIDQVMGEDNVGCLDDPGLCLCEGACLPDGLCDDALCGVERCSETFACLRTCGLAPDCSVRCIMEATPEANFFFEQYAQCVQDRCPNGGTEACIEANCRREAFGCDEGLIAVFGDDDCSGIFACARDCELGDVACVDACFYEGTPEGQFRYETIEACYDDACAASQTEIQASVCMADNCRSQILQCVPPTDCRLTGGDCEPEEACVPEAWGATYCRPSGGAAVGEPCEVGPGACVDGAICLNRGEGGLCHELCTVAADCDQGGEGPCERVAAAGAPFPVGVCNFPCDDADEDGACDEDDCAPQDPAIHPGAEEICDEARVDENCNGQRNEGCLDCEETPDDPDCPPVEDPEDDTPVSSGGGSGGGCTTTAHPASGSQSGAFWLLLASALVIGAARRRRTAAIAVLAAASLVLTACGDDNNATSPEPANNDGNNEPDTQDDEPDVTPEPDVEPDLPPPPTITDVQQGLFAPGELVTIPEAVVSSPVSPEGFFINSGSNRAHAGVWVQLTDGAQPPELSIGDVLTLTAEVSERFWPRQPPEEEDPEEPFDPGDPEDPTQTRTELLLASADDLEVTGQTEPANPLLVTMRELALPELAELYEGSIISVRQPVVTNRAPAFSTLTLDSILDTDATFYAPDLAWIEPGFRYETITGALQFTAGQYRIAPRGPEDAVAAPIDLNADCIPIEGYALCFEGRTWPRARTECAEQGGRLVILETAEENLRVGTLVRPWLEGAFWIGLSDLQEEGVWRWIDDTVLDYEGGWVGNEPNNAGGREHCTHSNWQEENGSWNDLPCGRGQPYVCEFPGEGATCTSGLDCAAGNGLCRGATCVAP